METITLNNGVEMPVLGYGVFLVSPEECERCVSDAIKVGYRLIDTAQAYYNEEGVGRAVKKCGVPRQELFLTTKVWISNAGQKKAAASIDESLRKLQTDYIDLLLIHQAYGDYYGTYRAMEDALRGGESTCHRRKQFPGRTIYRSCLTCKHTACDKSATMQCADPTDRHTAKSG